MTEDLHDVSRHWATKNADSPMRCYLRVNRQITTSELVDYLADHYSHVDPWQAQLNISTVTWLEPATAEDLAEREESNRRGAERRDRWEREEYVRLKAKFEPDPEGPTT